VKYRDLLLSGPKLKCIGQRREIALEYIVGRLSLEPSVTAARWRTVNTIRLMKPLARV
jgi:hypothetical protein